MEPERLEVGRIVKPHGIRGEVVVEVWSEAPDRFAPGARLGSGDRDFVIESSRPHQGRLLVKFEQIADRNDAETIRGVRLTIPLEQAAPLPEGSYYPFQLQGLDVVDTEGAVLGTLVRVDESPANDYWIVASDAREVLVPAVKAIVVGVDLDARKIVLDPPEGLFE